MEVEPTHALKAKAIASAKVKKDKIDCRMLSQSLRADLIPQSHVAAKPIGMQRELLGYRASLVRIRTGAKNVHSFDKVTS